MSGEGPVEEQVKFWDVAACFSEEEWMFLHEWQKDFYKNVMKEIHQALILMGYQILNPETLLRIYRGRDEFRTDHQAAATPAATEPPLAPRPTVLPDVLFRIRREEDLYCEDKPSSLEAGGFPVGPAAFSLQPEENSQLYPDGQEDLEQSHIGHHPPGHIPDVIIVNIKEEDDTCSTDHPDCEIIESTIDPAVGHGIMNIQEKLGESQDRTEETIIDLSEEEKTVAFQSANGEPNCVIQLQPEICHEMHGASSGPYENDFSILKHLNEHQGMAEVLFNPTGSLVVELRRQRNQEKKEDKVLFNPVGRLVVELRRQRNREKKEDKVKSNDETQTVGLICRDSGYFSVQFPLDLNVKLKAFLIGFCLFLNHMI
ncbi:hypothetical protein NDU88_000017 [Pleurodeles waltl]|uniref:KRAB domain-containing protein n=1 Tax=Pleurodeles waltl TaxID=8319 RepID=A0AAV7KNU1_PLEWA|nr:hypothetical protein NDU88_000017 [Pleurodeles waltl]